MSSQNAWKRYHHSNTISSSAAVTESSQFESRIYESVDLPLMTTITTTVTSTTAASSPILSSSPVVTTHVIDYGGLSNEATNGGYDEFEVDYLENVEYTEDAKDKAEEVARYNLATRVMSNGVEVIIAGDKSKTVEQNNNINVDNTNNIIRNTQQKSNILRILQSQSQKPMTLAPSTLQDQMILVEPSNVQVRANTNS